MRSQGLQQLTQLVSKAIGKVSTFKLHETTREKYQQYGSIIVESTFWPKRRLVYIFNPKDIETVFRKQGKCPYRPANEFEVLYRKSNPDRFSTVGLANLQGEEWLKQRLLVAPALLSNGVVRAYLPHQNAIADDFVDFLRHQSQQSANNGIIEDLMSCTNRYSLESISMISLNSRLGCLSVDCLTEDGDRLIRATKKLFEAYQVLYHDWPWWKLVTTPSFRKFCSAENEIYDIASKYIDMAVRDLEKHDKSGVDDDGDDDGDDDDGGGGGGGEEADCLLKTLLRTQGLDKKDVKILILDFIAGGINTVSTSLCFLLYHLSVNSDIQEKLHQELALNITSRDEFITERHLSKLSYLKACLKESFRIATVIPNLVRVLPEPIVVSGHHVPAGVPIILNFGVLCKHPDYFEDPEKFIPERWLGQSRRQNHPFSLLPFGFGNRMCAGRRISEIELYLAAIKTILNFKLISETREVKLRQDFIIVPENLIKIRLVDRP